MLRFIAMLLMLAGGGIAAIGGLALVSGIGIFGSSTDPTTSMITAIAGGAAIPLGLLLIAASESIHVLLDTEANTRKASEAMITMIADLREMAGAVTAIARATTNTKIADTLKQIEFNAQRTANAAERMTGMGK